MQNNKQVKSLSELDFRLPNGEKHEITILGNLGLLAIGDIGLMAWREVKMKFILENQKKRFKT